ncbi:MAG: serine hydrolase [Anaerolineae bacterium]|nr:serine hydrolase [Anaerolineae bacterium]
MRRGLIFVGLLLLVAGCRGETGRALPAAVPTAGPAVTATATVPAATTVVAPASSTPTATAEPAVAAFTPPDLRHLAARFDAFLDEQESILASYTVIDLESGQTVMRNGDLAISGTSMVKIPILVETYRVLDEAPPVAVTRLITETATLSGNYTANLLLELIAGQPDAFAGAQSVTQAMRRLGLYNTFIAVPYDEEPRPQYLSTYVTPANQRAAPTTSPDSSMQTTTADMGRLLQMVYECSQDSGALREQYAQRLLAHECAAIIEVMAENMIEAFIEAGVPEGVAVAHKHGWVGDTHGDAGLVLAEHPYVLVIALHHPGWLEWADSTVLIAELSHLAYAHFNDPAAYPASLLASSLPPLPTATPVPDLPLAHVARTRGAGLTLRAAPGGAELLILPEGLPVYLLPDEPVSAGGVSWRHVQTPWGEQGWAGSDFLELPSGG